MRVLGIETATPVCSVALVDGMRLLGEYSVNAGRTHSQRLMPMISALLSEAGLTREDLDGVVVSRGPGSYTGLRIGLTTGKALAFALQRPIAGVPTLEALAHNLSGTGALVCPVLDAKRGEVYTALYQTAGETPETVETPRGVGLRVWLEQLSGRKGQFVFGGDGAEIHRETILEVLGSRARLAPPHSRLPRAASVADLGRRRLEAGGGDDAFGLNPLYLRRSEAEILWDKRHGGRG